MSIGQDIKEYRRAHGLSQAEFASLVGSGQGAVTRWELGQRQPRGAALKAVREVLDGERLPPTASEAEQDALVRMITAEIRRLRPAERADAYAAILRIAEQRAKQEAEEALEGAKKKDAEPKR